MSTVLVINSGSSSLKYQLIDVESEQALAVGLVERIGSAEAVMHHRGPDGESATHDEIADHTAAFAAMLAAFAEVGPRLDDYPLVAVGHRVVHGGSRFVAPTLVTPEVEAAIDDLSPLAPLHNPANLEGIRAATRAFPGTPHVAVFDTAFHHTMAPASYTYAIDAGLAATHQVRRYGFHGTSHRYVSRVVAEVLGRPLGELNQIVLHLGNGASACAVQGGRSVDTSMGMTPLEGLVMGTRSGDIDPGAILALSRQAAMDLHEVDELLNRRSGLLGLTGSNDMRDVRRAADSGVASARLALDVTIHRLQHYIGAYAVSLGGLDALTFTAGVGENDHNLRREVCAGLGLFGVRLDEERNAARSAEPRIVSADDSRVSVLVVPTNEEREIARQCVAAVTTSL